MWYNAQMKKHWSVDETRLAEDPRAHAIWKLEQRINWGVGEDKVSEYDLRAHWNEIDIDPSKRRALSLALGM